MALAANHRSTGRPSRLNSGLQTALTPFLTIFLLQSWLPTILTGTPGVHAPSLYASLVFIGALVGIFGGSTLVARFGPARMAILMLAVASITVVALHFAIGSSEVFIIVTLFVIGIGLFGARIVMNVICAVVYPPEIRASGIGWAYGVGRIGAFAGPMIVGAVLASKQFRHNIFLVLATSSVSAAVLLMMLRRAIRKSSTMAASFGPPRTETTQ